MVSPYKKKKLERKGRVTLEANPPKNSLEPRRSKSSKPLSNKKFYLDIKNHATLKKIESKLTSLGASLELFLVKDVYCVVTDRDDYISSRQQQGGKNTPRGLITPSPFCSVSPATTDSPGDGVISKRTRSRAEAMLEKVRQQPQRTTLDILDSATSWGIPIYSYTKFQVWLEKIIRREAKDPKGVRELRGHYLKLETGSGRPDFRQFRIWPRLSFNEEETTAFPKPLSRHDPQRMTRKAGKVARDSSVAGGNGYCEMCRIHFDQLDTHITSSQHIRYASDPSHFTQLDSLISHHDLGNMGSLRKSLRIAKSPPVDVTIVKATPIAPQEGQTAPIINGHVTRSKSDKVLCNGLSPLQEKRKNSIRGSGGGNSGVIERKEDSPVKPEPVEDHNLRSRQQQGKCSPATQVQQAQAISARRNRLSRKRLSVEEKLIEDNKSYYRVEVLNSKLRSTEYFINQKQLEARVNEGVVNGNCTPDTVTPNKHNNHHHQVLPIDNKEQEEPVVVRFRKVRRSQLAVLSDEAESFMFGEPTKKESRKDDDSSESSDSDESSSADEVIPKKKIRKLTTTTNSECATLCTVTKDTESQTLLSSPRFKTHRGASTVPHFIEERKEDDSDDYSEITLDNISFSFENPPKKDPWIETFKRREEKEQFYYPHHHQYPAIPLPFEYPVYERLKLLSGKKGPGFGRRRDRFFRILDEGKPRKSPRCHASTLAIMSSLTRRRPIRECTSNPDFTYEEESRSSFPETVESSSSASEIRSMFSINNDTNQLPIDPSGDVYAIALARFACGETSTLQVGPGPCLQINPAFLDDPLPDIEMNLQPGLNVPLEVLIDHQKNSAQFPRSLDMDFRYLDADRDSGSDCSDLIGFSDDGRGVSGKRRKRKRNMTGWPVEKPRKKIVKKEEEHTVPVMIKCEPCEIKLEPMSSEVLEQLTTVKEEPPLFDSEGESPLVPAVKRGRGRPRKYPPLLTAVAPLSPQVIKSSPIKAKLPRFGFTPRRSCINVMKCKSN